MGNIMLTHDESEVPADPGTPACRDFSALDPRSPTLEIRRTPLEVPTQRSRLKQLVSLLDPRSPGQHISRTPLQVPRQAVLPEKPAVLAEDVLFGQVEETDLGELDVASVEDIVEGVPEPEKAAQAASPPIDLKAARAIFFEDLAAASTEAEEKFADAKEAVESIDVAMLCDEEEVKVTTEASASAELVLKVSALAVENSETNASAEAVCEVGTPAAVVQKDNCLPYEDLSTSTPVPRRLGKENTLKKQLFQTPDKARVRTPLSNVSSFHNSPLRRN